MQQNLYNLKIGILGLGLIGGSIYKALLKAGFKNLMACSSNPATINEIANNGFEASDNIEILNDCDIIFVCSPISETKNSIKKVFEINQNAIIADVASIKEDILQFAQTLEGCKFIATHPMAGTEFSGFPASFAELFDDANWVVIPSKTISEEESKIIKKLIKLMNANVVEMSAEAHDKSVALISHLPMLLSESLVSAVSDNNNALKLASSGFRDTTRLALTNKLLAGDMLNLNKNNIKYALELTIKEAEKLLNSDYFNENADKIINMRKNLYDANGKNNFKNNC